MPVERRRKKNLSARPPTQSPSLRFTPTAWAKLLYWRDLGTTEIGGFGISAAADLLLIEDVRLLRQRCTGISVQFDDAAVADFFDEQVDAGLQPERFSRLWVHTHPGRSAAPSTVDERTFARVFGAFQWSVMFILARGGATFARLQFSSGPGGAWEIPVAVDYGRSFAAADHVGWRRDYETSVTPEPIWDFDRDVRNDDPPDDWPFSLREWEELEDGSFGPGSFRSAKRAGADGPPAEYLGDRDRLRLDRPSASPAIDGSGSS